MTAVAFDTLRLARSLKEASFTDAQAEGAADAIAVALQSDLATKSDLSTGLAVGRAELKEGLAALRTELKADIAALRTELKADIAALRTELKADIATLRTELKDEIAALRAEVREQIQSIRAEQMLMRWMVGFVLAFQVAIFAKLFLH